MWGGKKAGSRTLCFCLGAPDAASCRSEHACEGFQSSWDVDYSSQHTNCRLTTTPPSFYDCQPTLHILDLPHIIAVCPPRKSFVTITILEMKDDDCSSVQERGRRSVCSVGPVTFASERSLQPTVCDASSRGQTLGCWRRSRHSVSQEIFMASV